MATLRPLCLPKTFFLLYLALACLSGSVSGNGIVDFLKCKVCEIKKMNGQIHDCNCKFETVDHAVSAFFIPLLANITARPYFRYFKINLEKPCPFWEDDGGMCTNEACSICPCEPEEVPSALLAGESHQPPPLKREGLSGENEYGWVSRAGDHGKPGGKAHSDHLGRVEREDEDNSMEVSGSVEAPLQPLDQIWEWTDIAEQSLDPHSGVFINLVKNPEKFTGYSGLSARLVWKAIQEENCFGGDTDTCFEKRVFYRLMSGLQGSITTQIARDYFFAPQAGDSHLGRWGPNIPMFIKAVGAHPSRLANLYFTFLFLARAVAKAQDAFLDLDYSLGDDSEAVVALEMIRKLVTLPNLTKMTILPDGSSTTLDDSLRAAVECSTGFDESSLFQSVAPSEILESSYWGDVRHQSAGVDLREEFRLRFRNISRIMDCVSCEKCRVWGKLEILGLGTAIKILLTPEKEMREIPLSHFLSRQEVVALINTLYQFAKSIHFASGAMELEFGEKIEQMQATALQVAALPLLLFAVAFLAIRTRQRRSKPAEASS